MAPQAERLRAEILARIDTEQTWSGRTSDAKVQADLAAATAAVLARFLDLIGTSSYGFTEPDRVRFRELGAGEARDGRGLEELLAAYRVGTRVIYTEFARALSVLDPSPDAQVALGEAVFALVDTLQAESADGYAQEAATHAGERDRRHRRLVEALLRADLDAAVGVAAKLGWVIPSRVVAALLPVESLRTVPVAADALLVDLDGTGLAVLPADPQADLRGMVGRLAQEVGGSVCIGPAVPPGELHRSLTVARLLADDADHLVWADDQLPILLLRGAPEVAAALRDGALSPLARLREPLRERLAATLASWLRHWGQRAQVASELSIHPQTVAYRINQLRDLFGDDLDDPDWRLQLQLALLDEHER